MPRADSGPPESVDGGGRRVSRTKPKLVDSGLSHLAVGFTEARMGFDRHRVHRGKEVARDAQGVHQYRTGGVVGREPRSADGCAGVVESLRAVCILSLI